MFKKWMEIPSESGSETKETFKIVLLGGYVFIIVFFLLFNNDDKNI